MNRIRSPSGDQSSVTNQSSSTNLTTSNIRLLKLVNTTLSINLDLSNAINVSAISFDKQAQRSDRPSLINSPNCSFNLLRAANTCNQSVIFPIILNVDLSHLPHLINAHTDLYLFSNWHPPIRHVDNRPTNIGSVHAHSINKFSYRHKPLLIKNSLATIRQHILHQ